MQTEMLLKVVNKWKAENLEIASPYSKRHIQSAFAKIGKSISKDIIEIYTTFGGLADEMMDSNLLSFWTLDQLVYENSSRKSDFVLFGDF